MNSKNPKIAAVIVTFNRLELLKKCIDAIENQTFLPETIYVVNNASTDGTKEYLEKLVSNVEIVPLNLNENIGGAGGFYTGIKTAHESNRYDAYWVMDDDGLPEKNCLSELVPYANNGFIGPLVIGIEKKSHMAFKYLKEDALESVQKAYEDTGYINDFANPFNGTLLSKQLIENIGYPKKEMFIWGDEVEFQMRSKKYGYTPMTIVKAIHYHPSERSPLYRDYLGRKSISYLPTKFKRYIKYRNDAYNRYEYFWKSKFNLKKIYYYSSHIFFYLFSRKLDVSGLKLFLNATKDGKNGDFTHAKEYPQE